jgi:hypothetical protein
MPLISKCMPEMVPAGIGPDAISNSASAWITSCHSVMPSSFTSRAAATSSTTGPQASAVDPGASSSEDDVSGCPKPMTSNMVNGLSQVA